MSSLSTTISRFTFLNIPKENKRKIEKKKERKEEMDKERKKERKD